MPNEIRENGATFSIKEYLLYKLDRNIAIIGVIVIGCIALVKGTPDSTNITMAAIGGLVGYIGGRTGTGK